MTDKLVTIKVTDTERRFLLGVMEQVGIKGSGAMQEFLALKEKLDKAAPEEETK